MPKLIPMCGLPRTGSTLFVNVLAQNPDITISPDSLLGPLLANIQNFMGDSINESQFKSDETYEMYRRFCVEGSYGWINSISNTQFHIDKCRSWGINLDLTFNLFPDIKLIFTVRDLRGIISSLDKICRKTLLRTKDHFYDDDFDFNEVDLMINRVEKFFEEEMISRPLLSLKELFEIKGEYLDKIKFIKYEDIINNTNMVIDEVYNFLEIPAYQHDLNNIKQGFYHDCIYLPYGHHKIKSKIVPKEEKYDKLPDYIQEKIINKYEWYYDYFYSDVLH
jgi:sulfotransferase